MYSPFVLANHQPTGAPEPALSLPKGLAGFETRVSITDHSTMCPPSRHEASLKLYSAGMPWGLQRWHGGHDLHFITFSCYHRQPLSGSAQRRDLLLKVLEQVRRRYQWVVMGYVVMPEHVHLLVSEPPQRPLATAMQALKLGFAACWPSSAPGHPRSSPAPSGFGSPGTMTLTSLRRASGWRSFAICIAIP